LVIAKTINDILRLSMNYLQQRGLQHFKYNRSLFPRPTLLQIRWELQNENE